MRIGLHDSDNTGFPNYALMKISAWHKARGDTVEWFMPLMRYDRVYSSKVFTFTQEDPYLPDNTIRGGTGYGLYDKLPDEIDAMYPDYSIYPDCDYAIGFLTRGCIRKCPWCIVPRKEGGKAISHMERNKTRRLPRYRIYGQQRAFLPAWHRSDAGHGRTECAG